MVRARDNFVMVGSTDFAHEQEGVDFVREQLPDGLHARALIDMFDAGTGRHYELDFLIIGWGAVFLVEMKHYEGRIEGDERCWLWTPPGALEPLLRDNPLSLTNHKCKVLKSKLEAYFKRHLPRQRVPFVQPLVFLSNPRVDNQLRGPGRTAVVTREGLVDALQRGKFPNANERRWRAINGPTFRGLREAFDEIGLGPRKTQLKVHSYLLGPVIADGVGYQDRSARHETIDSLAARARVYLVPQHTSVEERDRLRRAARRESQLLTSVREHPAVLDVFDFAVDAPLGPTLILDGFPGGVSLDAFLEHQDPSFDERLDIFRQLGDALAYCHRREVVHGGLHPGAVLVRRRDQQVQVRLFNFQLGGGRGASATLHRTSLVSDAAGAYQAPELVHDPRATSPAADCFSLGAVGHLLFTGQAPAADVGGLRERLDHDRCLDPLTVADELPEPIVETIRAATSVGDRIDDASFIVENLVSELRDRQAAEPESTAHVLAAEAGDILLGRYLVERVLGYGASARVLLVEDDQDKRLYALKVARDAEQNPRLDMEAAALEDFAHPRIVKLHAKLEFNGLTGLLLSRAGERTLHTQLAEEGGLAYDWALRYGEDLLDALEQCEEKGVLHRDIKPANLGVGASVSRGKKHLTLFDFSLVSEPEDKLDVGTPPYRDPYLWAADRRRWDDAADRWSAAITLHEMLTGVRPRFRDEAASPLDEDAELILAAERFDAALRDSLITFFERALAPALDRRFASAREMKRAWSACFDRARRPAPAAEAPPSAPAGDEATEPEAPPSAPAATAEPSASQAHGAALPVEVGAISDEAIAKIRRSTPIRALPLSPRALNALDRAGLMRAEELLALANNRLSAIRGIGRKVSAEILDLRDRWRARLDDRGGPEAEPFYRDYRGPELYLDTLEALGDEIVAALGDAGLQTTGALARAPKAQVEAVLARVRREPEALRELLSKLEREGAAAPPATLDAWIEALDIAGDKVADTRLRQFLGLEEPFVGRLDVSLVEVVEVAGVTRPAVARNLAAAIKRWCGQPWADALRSLAVETLEGLGGVAPLELAARALRPRIPARDDDERALLRCAALLRVAVELGLDERERGLRSHRRLRERPEPEARPRAVIWLVADPDLWLLVPNLGRKADELAKREVLAASAETERVLELVVQNTPLSAAELGLSRLVELAAWASKAAAASSRLELYPLGMAAARAIELSAQALAGPLSPEELERRVRRRYPECAELPPRPALDDLLAPLGLRWVEELGQYRRPEAHGPGPSRDSSTLSLHRPRTVVGPPIRALSPAAEQDEDALLAQEFEDQLVALVEDRKLRVLAVNAAYVPEAVHGLERVMGVRATALDKRLITAMREFVQAREGPLEILPRTDAAGPGDGNWPKLQAVAEQAGERLAAELLPPREPLLLIQPGLLARYDLRELLAAIVEAAGDERSEAIVLLNPIHEGERPDRIAHRLAIPGLLPGQIVEVPRAWIGNRHRAAKAG